MIRQQEHKFKYTTENAIKSSFIPMFTSRRPLQFIKNVLSSMTYHINSTTKLKV
jgi:hypothetical protein